MEVGANPNQLMFAVPFEITAAAGQGCAGEWKPASPRPAPATSIHPRSTASPQNRGGQPVRKPGGDRAGGTLAWATFARQRGETSGSYLMGELGSKGAASPGAELHLALACLDKKVIAEITPSSNNGH